MNVLYSFLQGREQPRLLPQDDGREAAGEVDGARVALREGLHVAVRRLVLRHSGESERGVLLKLGSTTSKHRFLRTLSTNLAPNNIFRNY